MKLTNKFIKENQNKTLKEVFPGLFETKLEVGKWYKHKAGGFLNVKEINGDKAVCFGIYSSGGWYDKEEGRVVGLLENIVPATNQEVLEALTKEAVKRGFKEGLKVMPLWETPKTHWEVHNNQTRFDEKSNSFYFGCCIFQNGTWATIIKPKQMTIQEIEKELGYEIKEK